jgi:hypothetical protein
VSCSVYASELYEITELLSLMLLENVDEIKVENDMGSVTEGDSIVKKTDEEDMPTFSGQKIKPEMPLLMDEVLGIFASVCVYVFFFCRP